MPCYPQQLLGGCREGRGRFVSREHSSGMTGTQKSHCAEMQGAITTIPILKCSYNTTNLKIHVSLSSFR